MKVLDVELDYGTDISAQEYRDSVIKELQKCIKEPFAMNYVGESFQKGQQDMLKQIIEYLEYTI
jgi:hypothetical protein